MFFIPATTQVYGTLGVEQINDESIKVLSKLQRVKGRKFQV